MATPNRWLLLLAAVCLATSSGAILAADAAGSKEGPDDKPAAKDAKDSKADAGEPIPLPDKRATLTKFSWAKDDNNSCVRLTLIFSYPKLKLKGDWQGAGTFVVTVPDSVLGTKIPRQADIGATPVADAVFGNGDSGHDVQIQMRLSTPSHARAYVVPVDRAVVIEADYPPETPAASPATDNAGPTDPGSQVVNVDFRDTDLRTIVEALVNQSGANIMLMPDVTGKYSLVLKSVTLNNALDALWEAWGLEFERLPGNIVLVGPRDKIGKDRTEDSLPLPSGWSVQDVLKVLAAEFPEVVAARDPADIPKDGPIPVRGMVENVGRARRWVAKLPAKTTSGPLKPLGPASEEELTVWFPHVLTLDALEGKV